MHYSAVCKCRWDQQRAQPPYRACDGCLLTYLGMLSDAVFVPRCCMCVPLCCSARRESAGHADWLRLHLQLSGMASGGSTRRNMASASLHTTLAPQAARTPSPSSSCMPSQQMTWNLTSRSRQRTRATALRCVIAFLSLHFCLPWHYVLSLCMLRQHGNFGRYRVEHQNSPCSLRMHLCISMSVC